MILKFDLLAPHQTHMHHMEHPCVSAPKMLVCMNLIFLEECVLCRGGEEGNQNSMMQLLTMPWPHS